MYPRSSRNVSPRRTNATRTGLSVHAELDPGAYPTGVTVAEEVMAAYQQVGSVSGLADHFNVPRHTVQGWARQLRKQGHAIGRVN